MSDIPRSQRTDHQTSSEEEATPATETPATQTSLSLLARLRDESTDGPGWQEFVRRYQPLVYKWCRRWGLQDSDAQDVSQNVMLELAKQMRVFEYQAGGRFRAWLKTVTRRAWYDYTLRRKRAEFQAAESDLWRRLASPDAETDLLETLDEECHREMLQLAMERVRTRVKEVTWSAFQQTELDDQPADQVAAALGIQRASVYVARGRVRKMIVEEVKRLDQIDETTQT